MYADELRDTLALYQQQFAEALIDLWTVEL